MNEEPTGRSKTLDFSPAQPWRAARLSSPKSETRLIPRKAAALRLTHGLRFTPHASRFLGAT
jgi:hypothetical protein